jgi:hypothetical protein
MNLTIEMPFEAYRGLVSEVDPSSVEFNVLAGGYVERRRRKGRSGLVVQITCERNEARLLLTTAVHTCPEAASAIAEALSVTPRTQ